MERTTFDEMAFERLKSLVDDSTNLPRPLEPDRYCFWFVRCYDRASGIELRSLEDEGRLIDLMNLLDRVEIYEEISQVSLHFERR